VGVAQANLVGAHSCRRALESGPPILSLSFGSQMPPASTRVRGRRVQMYDPVSWLPADSWCVSLTASWRCLKSGLL